MAAKQSPIDVDDAQYRTTPFQQATAACTGALITSFLVTPLDVVKIRLQAQRKVVTKPRCFLFCNGLMDHICGYCPSDIQKQWFQRPGHFNGTLDAFMKISRTEGISSLWSGLSPTLVLAVPSTITYFVTYEQLRLTLKDYSNKNRREGDTIVQPMWVPFVAGATARFISVTVVSPLELIRTKMQATRLSYFEMGQALKMLIQQNGVFGLWRGVFSTLSRDVPFSAIYFSQYEALKSFYGPSVPSFGFNFMAGAISGSIAALLTLPFDVVKTHQQIGFGERYIYSDSGSAKKSQTIWQIFTQLHSQYGIRGLFTGLVPRVIKVAPACAIMISTFEYGKIAFSKLAKYNTSSSDRTKADLDNPTLGLSSNSLPVTSYKTYVNGTKTRE